MSLVLPWLGFLVLVWRMAPWRLRGAAASIGSVPSPTAEGAHPLPFVSIIVPARNEAENLPTLLDSLQALAYPSFEIIVIDDHSEDDTARIAEAHGATVLSAPDKPADWAGKTWACWHGAKAARGQYLLFTDADTLHLPDSLREVMAFMRDHDVALCSSPPYHRTEKFWESLLGPFHMLLLLATAPYDRPTPRRVFAIGQYLLFKTEYYWKIGGHETVRETLAEDLAFASASVEQGERYAVYMKRPLFQVRMYDSFLAFVAGWRRIFRWGMERGTTWSTLEVMLVIFAITGFGRMFSTSGYFFVAMVSLGFVAWAQRRWGEFSAWGVVLFPFSIIVFTTVTLLSLADRVLRRPSYWRGRAYRAGVN